MIDYQKIFLISQSIVKKTINAQNKAFNENDALLNLEYISREPEILKMVGEYVM
jgi:hypothetical protein